jgi:NAD(P)-dependent dehydrogenase (short-subunit alcohol dehydrogenase family)
MIDLKEKVVIITGASSGIGRSAAITFARKGCKVVLAARRINKLKELKEEIAAFNKNCWYLQSDVSREKDVIRLFDEAERVFGRIGIVINCAGRGCEVKVPDISHDEWHSVINTNLTSVFLCTREAARRMIANGIEGHIITVCSVLGRFGLRGHAAYCASKHGVTGFNKAARWEFRRQRIKVSTVYPANVDTELFNALKTVPRRRELLAAEDVAGYLVAIASRSLLRILAFRTFLVWKRVYYFTRYFFS